MTPDPEAPADPPLNRVYVDAFDRLADRLLERLRSLRQDVDGDLATVRAELATLRQSVDAVADRVQMRHLRSTVEEVNGEVIALRRAVLADRGEPGSGSSGLGPAAVELLDDLQQVVAGLAAEVQRLADRPAEDAPVRLDDDQVDELVRAVADRVVEQLAQRPPERQPERPPERPAERVGRGRRRADVRDAAPGLAD